MLRAVLSNSYRCHHKSCRTAEDLKHTLVLIRWSYLGTKVKHKLEQSCMLHWLLRQGMGLRKENASYFLLLSLYTFKYTYVNSVLLVLVTRLACLQSIQQCSTEFMVSG
jgi:hypothetical protein